MNTSPLFRFGLAALLGAFIAGGLALAESSEDRPGPGHAMHGMHHSAKHGEYGGKGSRHGMGRHHGGDDDHGKKGLYGPHWESTLTDEQRNRLDSLKLAHARAKMPLKAKARAVRVQLAALATAESPDASAIDAKIKEMLEIKLGLMRDKYRYIAARRAVLTPEQRISYDMEMMKKAMHKDKHKRKGKGHHGGKHRD